MDPTIIARLAAYAEDIGRADAQIADLEAERDAYQRIAYAALDQLHSTTIALDRTRTQLQRLLAAHRRSRAVRSIERVAA